MLNPSFLAVRLAAHLLSLSLQLSTSTRVGSQPSALTLLKVAKGSSEMSEKASEKSEMSSVEFVQSALRERIAPPAMGGVKTRIRHAARVLGWSFSRTKDAWYADPRISIDSDEMREIEEESGLRYGKEELRDIDALIASADAFLAGEGSDQIRPFVAAMRALLGAIDRSGTSNRDRH